MPNQPGCTYKKNVSRALLVLIAIFLQVAVMTNVVVKIEYIDDRSFQIFLGLLSFATTISIINREMTTDAKVPWVIIVILFPLVGSLAYIFFSGSHMNRRHARLYKEAFENGRGYSHEGHMEIEHYKAISGAYFGQSSYLYHATGYVAYQNTKTTYYPLGENFWQGLLTELKKAENFIFMEYFIIDDGLMWNAIEEILVEKVRQGVEVRLMFDDFGSIKTLPVDFPDRLNALGLKVVRFNPFTPVVSEVHNNRDHRKITVIDGKVGFIGGANLADEYINEIHPFGHWKDTALRLEGPAVAGLTMMFLQSYDVQSGKTDDYNNYILEEPEQFAENGLVFPFGDGPRPAYHEYIAENAYLNLIYQAKNYLWITTPYLIPGSRLMNALRVAAKRGVDVRIVTPGIPDKKFVYMVTRSNYRSLQEVGVKIYEYTPGFIHAKQLLADDEVAILGTINMDYRSLVHHFECGVWMYKTDVLPKMQEDFEHIFAKCREMDGFKQSFPVQIICRIAHAFTPLL